MSNTSTVSVATAHESLVSIVVILLVIYIMVEVAGVNSKFAEWALLILGSALLLRGMANNGAMAAWLAQYPWVPGSPASPPSKG